MLSKLSRTVKVRTKKHKSQGEEEVGGPACLLWNSLPPILYPSLFSMSPVSKNKSPQEPTSPSHKSPYMTKAACYRQTPRTECALCTRHEAWWRGGPRKKPDNTTQTMLGMEQSRRLSAPETKSWVPLTWKKQRSMVAGRWRKWPTGRTLSDMRKSEGDESMNGHGKL